MPQAPTSEDGEAGTSRHATHPTYPLLQCSISKTLPRKASYSPRTHTWRDTVRHTPAPPVSITRLTLLPRLSASGFTSRCSRRARRPVRAPDRARRPARAPAFARAPAHRRVLVLVALLVPLLVPLLVLVPLLTAVLVLVALLVPLLVLVALLTTLLNIARSSRAISRFATNFFFLILWLMYFSADISVESQNISLISA
jgi:hypothetical protein